MLDFGITHSRSHLLPPASATSRKTAKSPPGLVSAARFAAGLRYPSWVQAQKYRYLSLMRQCGSLPEAIRMNTCSARYMSQIMKYPFINCTRIRAAGFFLDSKFSIARNSSVC